MHTGPLLAHARSDAPEESCGLVVCHVTLGERYIPCRNVSTRPEEMFVISPEDYLQACNQGEVVAVVHSHPGGERYLSPADRQAQRQSGLPWWVICNERIYRYRCVPALLGRQFEHGVTDCYTLFRDAYHLAGIDLPDFPREDDWWKHGKNYYLDNLTANGFRLVRKDPQPGDVMLCCYASSTPNHAAVYCGEQHILHQVPTQLSKREVYDEQWQRMTHSVWRHKDWQLSFFTGIYNDLAAGSD